MCSHRALCHDPVRREVARVALNKLLKDGRIHFEGNASELRAKARDDEYIQSFLS